MNGDQAEVSTTSAKIGPFFGTRQQMENAVAGNHLQFLNKHMSKKSRRSF